MTRLFVANRPTGPAWVPGRAVRDQPYWTEHAEFMDRLFADGRIFMGGPYSDGSGALLIVHAQDEGEVRRMLEPDPWVLQGVLLLGDVKEWTVFLDARRGT